MVYLELIYWGLRDGSGREGLWAKPDPVCSVLRLHVQKERTIPLTCPLIDTLTHSHPPQWMNEKILPFFKQTHEYVNVYLKRGHIQRNPLDWREKQIHLSVSWCIGRFLYQTIILIEVFVCLFVFNVCYKSNISLQLVRKVDENSRPLKQLFRSIFKSQLSQSYKHSVIEAMHV